MVDEALREVARAAEEKRKRNWRFVDTLARDLHEPLGEVVRVASSLVRAGHAADDKPAVLLRIARSANRMQRLVADLLGFARARVSLPITRVPVAIDVLCRRDQYNGRGNDVHDQPAAISQQVGGSVGLATFVSPRRMGLV